MTWCRGMKESCKGWLLLVLTDSLAGVREMVARDVIRYGDAVVTFYFLHKKWLQLPYLEENFPVVPFRFPHYNYYYYTSIH